MKIKILLNAYRNLMYLITFFLFSVHFGSIGISYAFLWYFFIGNGTLNSNGRLQRDVSGNVTISSLHTLPYINRYVGMKK
jgi:hypothetical protein